MYEPLIHLTSAKLLTNITENWQLLDWVTSWSSMPDKNILLSILSKYSWRLYRVSKKILHTHKQADFFNQKIKFFGKLPERLGQISWILFFAIFCFHCIFTKIGIRTIFDNKRALIFGWSLFHFQDWKIRRFNKRPILVPVNFCVITGNDNRKTSNAIFISKIFLNLGHNFWIFISRHFHLSIPTENF